jgi:hypothetical protein
MKSKRRKSSVHHKPAEKEKEPEDEIMADREVERKEEDTSLID